MPKPNCLRIIIIVFISFFSTSTFSQSDSYDDLKRIRITSDSLYKLGAVEESYNLFYQASMDFGAAGAWERSYIMISYLRNRYQKEGDFIKAGEILKEYEKLLPEDETFIKAKLAFKQAYNYTRLLAYDKSINKYKESLNLFLSIDKKLESHNKFIVNIYKNLSNNYARIGDMDSAIEFCLVAIDFCNANDMASKMCELTLNKGQYHYYKGEYDLAIDEYQKALDLCPNTSVSYINVRQAEVYLDLKEMEKAKSYLDIALRADPSGGQYYSTIKARYLFEIGALEEGLREKEIVLGILKEKNDIRGQIKELTRIAEALMDEDLNEEALNYAHQALCLFYPDMHASNESARPTEDDNLPYVYVVEALYIKAKYFKKAYSRDKKEEDLNEALYYYNRLLHHFDNLKSEQYASNSKYRLGTYSQKIYSEVITYFVDLYKEQGKNEVIENAFSLAQRANSFVLRNAISDRKALELAGVDQDSLEQYLQLVSKVASDEKKDSAERVSVYLEFDSYKAGLLKNYPSYGKFEEDQEIELSEVQSLIGESTLVVKYYYHNNLLTVFGISKHSIFAENIELSEQVDSLISANLNVLSQNDSNDSLATTYLTNSKTIFDLILGDFLAKYDLEGIDHLTIVPDGPLKKVAFNALAINDNQDWNDPNAYLMSQYSVNYMYYCSQLKLDEKSYDHKDGFIGFGIEYEDDFLKEIIEDYITNFKGDLSDSRSISLSPLKYADDEALNTAEILDGTSYVNTEVTPMSVISNINNFDVVHFSAHAFVDEEDYLNSFVVLNKDEGDKYQLRYADILNLNIDSELVVLSACQTGSGKSVEGEGLMSLSRAFVQSGSSASMGAYWNAPDYATKELMTLFYSNLKEGMTKSKALQQAQVEYLTNDEISSPTIRSPFYWASWAVYGDNKPLEMNNSFFDFTSRYNGLLLLLIGLLMFGLGSFLYSRLKR